MKEYNHYHLRTGVRLVPHMFRTLLLLQDTLLQVRHTDTKTVGA